MYVNRNGEVIHRDLARIQATDRGFLYGEGCFTELRVYGGKLLRLSRHVDRLARSLTAGPLPIAHVLGERRLEHDIKELCKRNRCPDAIARLTVSAGPLHPEGGREAAEPNAILTVEPFLPEERYYAEGIALAGSPLRRLRGAPLARHCLSGYVFNRAARREAEQAGADQALLLDHEGCALETDAANLFAVIDRTLVTPPPSEGLVPGIARETVMHLAARLGIVVHEERLPPARLAEASELFLTSCVLEVAPVQRLDTQTFAPVPGPVTDSLREAYREEIARAAK